ncbi:hypothetical protein AWENTII_012637 [Aspergillus wentii]
MIYFEANANSSVIQRINALSPSEQGDLFRLFDALSLSFSSRSTMSTAELLKLIFPDRTINDIVRSVPSLSIFAWKSLKSDFANWPRTVQGSATEQETGQLDPAACFQENLDYDLSGVPLRILNVTTLWDILFEYHKQPMKISSMQLIRLLGGACGSRFCQLALEEGHAVTAFVRNATKIPPTILQNEAVHVIEGTLDDEPSLERASKCGADTFVSFAGPPVGEKGTPLTNGYKALIPKLSSQNITRLLILCTPSYTCDSDTPSFLWRLGAWTMKTFSPGQYREMVSVGVYLTSLSDTVQWTLFRVGGLTNGAEEPVEATYLGSGRDKMWIGRGSVARWVLDEAIRRDWVGRGPYICNV